MQSSRADALLEASRRNASSARPPRPRPAARRTAASLRARGGRSRGDGLRAQLDVAGCIVATVLAWMGTAMPPGSAGRVALVLPVLLFVPGYLLMQAFARSAWDDAHLRRRHAVAALGVSPAVVGLVALSTALVPGGFRLLAIANALLGWCVVLAAAVLVRRILQASRRPVAPSTGSAGVAGAPAAGPSAAPASGPGEATAGTATQP